MQSIINYIIDFLTRGAAPNHLIGYCNDRSQWSQYRVVIVASNFFNKNIYGTPQTEPSLPLKYINNIPILYGSPQIERIGDTIICHADLIASSFYLLTRYEEMLYPDTNRDQHHRYIGKNSLPVRANFIHRPIVDEYSTLLLHLVRQAGIQTTAITQGFNKIYLTHDVDSISNYRRLRGIFGGIIRATMHQGDKLKDIIKSNINIENDPAYTFRWIIENDNQISQAEQIYFIKSIQHAISFDYPGYNIYGKDFDKLIKLINTKSINPYYGLHSSYASGAEPKKIKYELSRLEKRLSDSPIIYNRYHYLRTIQPNDMQYLHSNGITEDFSLGYPDYAGFRLGTSRAVRYINPNTCKLTNLILHPLTIMDCSLSDSKYMKLNYEEAFNYSQTLINSTRIHHGDLCLLWHNTIFNTNNYHKKLYKEILKSIRP